MSDFSTAVDRYFRITERGSTISAEVRGGLITFLSMVYILTVNPIVLGAAATDVSWSQLFTSTALAAAISCLLMGFYARMPIALAPGMGFNAFMSYTICLSLGICFSCALLCVFASGLLFLAISVTRVGTTLIEVFPKSLRFAFPPGMGLFIIIVGLSNAHIIVSGTGTILSIGELDDPGVLLGLFSVFITLGLWIKKVWGVVLIGIVSSLVIGLLSGIVSLPSDLSVSLDFGLVFSFFDGFGHITGHDMFLVVVAIFVLTVLNLFDTTGTLMAISDLLSDSSGVSESQYKRALVVSSVSTMAGAVAGTSTTATFMESCAGVESGSKTGLTAVVVAVLFIVSLFFSSVFKMITNECIVGALVFVGILMMSALGRIDWRSKVDAVPALMTVFMTGLTCSITNGMAFGLLTYVFLTVMDGRRREIHPVVWGLALVFIIYFALYHSVLT